MSAGLDLRKGSEADNRVFHASGSPPPWFQAGVQAFHAAMPSATLASYNRALDRFLTSLTRRIVVHRLRVSLPIILAPRPQPTPRQRRRLKRAVLREFRKRCGVRK